MKYVLLLIGIVTAGWIIGEMIMFFYVIRDYRNIKSRARLQWEKDHDSSKFKRMKR